MAMGAGCGCSPNALAPFSNKTPDDLTGKGGHGYGLDRGASNGPG